MKAYTDKYSLEQGGNLLGLLLAGSTGQHMAG
jgi:hypothetical protein